MGRRRHTGRPWERIRKLVIDESDVCWLCGRGVNKDLPYPHPMSASVDLVVPLSRGGNFLDRENLRLAHLYCNESRGNRPVFSRRPQSREW